MSKEKDFVRKVCHVLRELVKNNIEFEYIPSRSIMGEKGIIIKAYPSTNEKVKKLLKLNFSVDKDDYNIIFSFSIWKE